MIYNDTTINLSIFEIEHKNVKALMVVSDKQKVMKAIFKE